MGIRTGPASGTRRFRGAYAAIAVLALAQAGADAAPDRRIDIAAIDPAVAASYDRGDWSHWHDADGDCQDTRDEVLLRDADGDVAFDSRSQCDVAAGRWVDPYGGRVLTNPSDLDVDHVVPLRNAHVSGGHAWDAKTKAAFANDLAYGGHLVAADDGLNRAKGADSPDQWMPPNQAYRCTYLEHWKRIKLTWDLSMTRAEYDFVEAGLAACAAGRIVPGSRETTERSEDESQSCCKICRSSKACGDSCISASYTCSKPEGCACDG